MCGHETVSVCVYVMHIIVTPVLGLASRQTHVRRESEREREKERQKERI